MAKAARMSPLKWGIASFVVTAGVVSLLYIVSPMPRVITPANIGATSLQVAWYTKRESKGCAVAIVQTKEFTLLEQIKASFYRDYIGKYVNKTCFDLPLNTHVANLSDLYQRATYKIYVITGLRRKEADSGISLVTTGEITKGDQPPVPEPAYGSVIYTDQKPADTALVFLYKKTDDDNYLPPLLALTNNQGNYAIDLANFESDSYIVQAIDHNGNSSTEVLSAQYHAPFPPVVIVE